MAERAQLKHSCPEGQETEAEDSVTRLQKRPLHPGAPELTAGAAPGVCGGEIPSTASPWHGHEAPPAQPGASRPLLAAAPRAEQPQPRVAVINLLQRPAINLEER